MIPPPSCAQLSDSSWRGDVGISCYVWQSHEVETRPAETCLLHLLLLRAPLPACLQRSPTPDPRPLVRSAAHCPPSLPPAAGPPRAFLPSTAWSKNSHEWFPRHRGHHWNPLARQIVSFFYLKGRDFVGEAESWVSVLIFRR